ncbi:hypothetical protein HH308_18070 [Gordonia sp. TBRC 11910]|uniref:Uncharacterized protein n=1 Tax=Gordonia asplenii TaxID=2725283 RepID=A0A848KY07_9ACTN|nr:hypothetical protein [Gordonia asplenii]NMO03122.1 hypothetical protein [Gordonia asplenii]
MSTREMRTVYGLVERAFRAGTAQCRRDGWERCRKSKHRPQGYYRFHYYVRADDRDPNARSASVAIAAQGPDVDDLIDRVAPDLS